MLENAGARMNTDDIAAECHTVVVPNSPYLNENRIARINAGRYEGEEIRGALHVTGPDDRVLEMGAGLGVVGAICAKNQKPQKVVSFEANPALLPHINALYELNALQDRITVRNAVVLAEPNCPETVAFHVQSSYLGSSLLMKADRKTTQIDVPTVPFEKIRRELSPTVLLCDIEGGELAFLEHADLAGIRAVVIEFHPEAYGVAGMRKCKDILRSAGFVKEDSLSSRTVWTCTRDL